MGAKVTGVHKRPPSDTIARSILANQISPEVEIIRAMESSSTALRTHFDLCYLSLDEHLIRTLLIKWRHCIHQWFHRLYSLRIIY